MNRRRMLINATRQLVHNGVTLPDLPTESPLAVIWDAEHGLYYCIDTPGSTSGYYNLTFDDSYTFRVLQDNYDNIFYYTLSAPYDTWSSRTERGYSGYIVGGNAYGVFFFNFTCFDVDHILYACQNVYDMALNSTATWLRDADTQSFDEKNGSFPEPEYRPSWEIIGTTLHINNDLAMADRNSNTAQPWYSSRSTITSVEVHSGVTRIGKYAFQHCTAITSVNIASGVLSVGYGAFWGCTSLTSVSVPNTVTTLDYAAFNDCTSLVSIALPNSITTFGQYVFAGCISLQTATVPSGVTVISQHAYRDDHALVSVTIPVSVVSIQGTAFYACGQLTSITYGGTMSQWNAITKGTKWNQNTGAYTIHCTDGDLSK